jgi:outer membrane cobalamin receptor
MFLSLEGKDSADLSKVSHADPLNINAGIRYKGFSFRTMYDKFETSDPQSNVSFKSFYLDVQQRINLSPKFTITPRVQYINQEPWYYDYPETDEIDFSTKATRIVGQLDANADLSRKVNINFGALYFSDNSHDLLTDENILTLNNFAVYAQALLKHRLANATIGFRFEKNNFYDGAFVPRIALTKKIENFHFKVLFSKSFRSPSLQNVELDTTGANPERSNVFEFELGYQFTPEMLLAVNAFHISTKDVIIYGSRGEGETFEEWYENYDKSGSQGVEVVYSIRRKKWYGQLTYSFSQTLSDNTVDKYQVPQTTKQYVGFPAHKITLNSSITLFQGLSVNPSFIYAGKRYAYTTYDEDTFEPVSTELRPYVLANLFLNYKDIVKGLTAGVGFYDLFNANPEIPQAYNGGEGAYAPIPGRSREFVVKLSYQFNFSR